MSSGGGPEPGDAAVVAQVLGGDQEAFGILIRRHGEPLRRYATRMLGSADTADDVLAESFIRAYRHLSSCRDPAQFRTWFFRIVSNRCKSVLTRARREHLPLEAGPPLLAADDPAGDLERGEAVTRVEQALGRLSAEKREAFLLKHVEGLSYEEMAARTGERVPALKMRVHRAREALLEELEDMA
jgi:RNA polymerase sigma-70 factor, ECF subfamily